MFTGIVQELGTVTAVERRPPGAALSIACRDVLEGAAIGDSISVNGVCLTVVDLTEGQGFVAEVMGESLARSALGDLEPGDAVDLEPALRLHDRLGGHLVQGHVDGVGEVLAVREERGDSPDGASVWTVMEIALPASLEPYVVEKGSITVDGVSLTVTRTGAGAFAVALIPHTLAVTALGRCTVGDRVNLEVDVVAKYVERMLTAGVRTPYGRQDEA